MLRSSLIGIGLAVTALLAFQVSGCGDSGGGGGAGTSGGTAGTTGTGGSGSSVAGTTGTGGTTGGGATGGSGSGVAGTTGTGGSGSGVAGTTGTGGSGSGVAGTTGTGGAATGTAGTTGTGGVTGTCPASITDKSTTCTAEGLACPKTCGIENKGTKTCTCTTGVFMCETVAPTCHYAAGTALDCYRLPSPVAACPTGTQHNGACTATACVPCSGYADSGGTAKTGYCVCVGTQWKCASDKEWPVF